MKNFQRTSIALIICLGAFLLLNSCGKKNKWQFMTADEAFRSAMEKYERGKYLDASEQLSLVTMNYSGSSIIDSAQYFLAECHFRMKEYLIAVSEYERLIYQYSSSHLVDDAKYKIGLSYFKLSPHYALDQEFTFRSIDEFQEFTEFYPNSELVPEVMDKIFEARLKLAKKSYRSGELYFKMRDYDSAILYFDEILDYYYDTDYAPTALLKKGQSLYKMKKYDEAAETTERVLEKYPNMEQASKAEDLLKRIQSAAERSAQKSIEDDQ